MEAFAENANDVMRYDGIDTRRGELSLQEGTVRTSDGGTKLNITIEKTGSTVDIPEDEFSSYGTGDTVNIGEFTYIVDDDRIAYEGGGVVRGDDSGSVFLKRPQVRCDDETAVISLVTISADDRSIQSSGQVGFTISEVNRTSKAYSGVAEVSIDVDPNSQNSDAWNSTLDDWSGGNDGTCSLGGGGQVVVTLTEVDIEY
nr:hypothetical protein [Natrinema limicola]